MISFDPASSLDEREFRRKLKKNQSQPKSWRENWSEYKAQYTNCYKILLR
jgi:hypothetical protein